MKQLRSQLVRLIRWFLARQGVALVNLSKKYGLEPWFDVAGLAKAWSYPVTTFFDVGGNDGDTALAASKHFPGIRIFSFEPHPSTYAALNARVGNYPNFRSFNIALGATAGKMEMFEYESSRLNSLVPNAQFAVRFNTEGTRIPVQCTTVDLFCEEHHIERIDVLKVDTEGFDLMVLQGCEQMLRRRAIRFIYVEFNDLQAKEGTFGGALVPMDAFLRPYGYRFVATYIDKITAEDEMFLIGNALFALPPNR